MAQVRQRLRLGRVGPEEEREVLPGLGRVAVEEEIGEQRRGPPRVERRQRHIAEAKVERAEEADAESRWPHSLPHAPWKAPSTPESLSGSSMRQFIPQDQPMWAI